MEAGVCHWEGGHAGGMVFGMVGKMLLRMNQAVKARGL
jgi:hypothetical protein